MSSQSPVVSRQAKKLREKVVSFKAYAGKGYFVRVFIYRTRALMLMHFNELAENAGGRSNGRAVAAFSAYEKFHVGKDGKMVRSKEFGTVLLNANQLGVGTVAHEMAHAAVFRLSEYNKRKANFTAPRREERLAETIDELVRSFWVKYQRAEKNTPWLKDETN